jgi:HNH endonuclease
MKSKRKPTRILPPADYLGQCLRYNRKTGEFRWKTRPREHFSTDGDCSKWNTRYAGTIAGNISAYGYRIIKIGQLYRAPRIAWKLMTGEEPPEMLDHKDGNRANDSWKNLRIATQTEQNWNTHTRECVSGYRGVSRNGKKWKAQISIDGRIQHIGTFDTPENASVAYEIAAKKVHDRFYRPKNQPDLKRR